MRKILTKSWLAKLLVNCHTITLFGFIHSKKKELNPVDANHECIHIDQWEELTILSYIVTVLLVLFGATKWLLVLPPFVFYIIYITEWVVRLFKKGNAYRNISFEKEAYNNEKNLNYLHERRYFAMWL